MITKVLSNVQTPRTTLFDLKVSLPEGMNSPVPGQFAHIMCGEGTTLRRPISIADYDAESRTVRFCYDVRGKGTDYLSNLKPGDDFDFLSPLGTGFSVRDGGRALLVGGGIGVYPLIYAARKYGSSATALLGFRNEALATCSEDFKEFGADVSVITDDGSNGRKGFVTELLAEALDELDADIILACGPGPMLEKVAEMAEERGIYCEVSLEERMACGLGACMGCACKVKAPESLFPDGYTYKRVCADGPVFDSREVIWK